MMMCQPPLLLTPTVVFKTNRLCVLYQLAVTVVSVFSLRHYHLNFHQKQNWCRKNRCHVLFGLMVVLDPVLFQRLHHCWFFIKKLHRKQIVVTYCLYLCTLLLKFSLEISINNNFIKNIWHGRQNVSESHLFSHLLLFWHWL